MKVRFLLLAASVAALLGGGAVAQQSAATDAMQQARATRMSTCATLNMFEDKACIDARPDIMEHCTASGALSTPQQKGFCLQAFHTMLAKAKPMECFRLVNGVIMPAECEETKKN